MAKRVPIILITLTLILAACGPAPTPEIMERTVEVPVEQTVEVTTVVEQTVAPEEETDITLAYGRFINVSFGPGPAPFEAIKNAV
ncbi:MAG: hypothetical protein KGY78_11985, partial [Anaerolineae bacterium]|nr:hypothetical protein [Anaerolineae bacterium]